MSKINRKKLLNPLFATDSYKHSHHGFVPAGTTLLYSHLTPRGNKRFLNNYPDHDGKIVVYGISYLKLFIKFWYLVKSLPKSNCLFSSTSINSNI